MPTSNSSDFTVTTDQIIHLAYREIGVVGQRQSISSDQKQEGMDRLNMMVQAWGGKGVYLWALDDLEISFTDSSVVASGGSDYVATKNHISDATNQPGVGSVWQSFWKKLGTSSGTAWVTGSSYTNIGNIALNNNVLSIKSARIKNVSGSSLTNIEIPIKPMDDYFALADPTIEGRPIEMYFRRKASVDAFVYPLPDVAANYLLELRVYRSTYDFDSGDNNPDFLKEWSRALYLGLAESLAPAYGKSANDVRAYKERADDALELAMDANRETGSLRFIPSI